MNVIAWMASIVPVKAYIAARWRVNAECGYWIVSLVSIACC